jgi:hypothetical protein
MSPEFELRTGERELPMMVQTLSLPEFSEYHPN